jgi:hypothetical protein
MTLKVIGAGWGRTGTLSLKLALEQLGLGPCYHMLEVLPRPEHVAVWHKAGLDEKVDWDALFEGFQSGVDWPVARFWRELNEAYPKAKFILTARPTEDWYKSFSKTILDLALGMDPPPPEPMLPWAKMVDLIITEQTFGNRLKDKSHIMAAYDVHNADVRRTIPKARLLDFDVAQGWEPLCRFLGVAVPSTDFPRTNTTQDFRDRVLSMRSAD